ncbi:hypothetical protein BpHYR1_042345 [Brachionus plicatilis]|uniref:Uncharacterized protein n=1 Tax=Brachionus plicatilis TaxID=10195 RepID=A0A3M7SUU9_BRAPC|nr:hypothetical protein BpHYR1_042345 [Brachionus plicatilis]
MVFFKEKCRTVQLEIFKYHECRISSIVFISRILMILIKFCFVNQIFFQDLNNERKKSVVKTDDANDRKTENPKKWKN